jgi:predicted permease
MALSAVLLVSALLLVYSIFKLQHVDPGFNAQDLYAMRLELPRARYSDARTDDFSRQLRDRVLATPGVANAVIASSVPPQYGFMNGLLAVEGRPIDDKAQPFIPVNWVDPAYFDAIGLRVLAGRTFDSGKTADDEVILNIGAAKKLWGSDSPIGKRIKIVSPGFPADSSPWNRVVGVVADAASGDMTSDRTQPMVYLPRSSIQGMIDFNLIVRARPGMHPMQAAQAAARQLDPLLAPPAIKSVQDALFGTFAQTRFTMLLMAAFAAVAVLLSAIGLYGVIAYAVAQRTREIGIRMALGATRRDIGRRVAGQGLSLVAIGLAIGLGGGVMAAKLIAGMLFGVRGADPLVLGSTTGILAAVALLATLVPMRRATRVDPAIAMRAD